MDPSEKRWDHFLDQNINIFEQKIHQKTRENAPYSFILNNIY